MRGKLFNHRRNLNLFLELNSIVSQRNREEIIDNWGFDPDLMEMMCAYLKGPDFIVICFDHKTKEFDLIEMIEDIEGYRTIGRLNALLHYFQNYPPQKQVLPSLEKGFVSANVKPFDKKSDTNTSNVLIFLPPELFNVNLDNLDDYLNCVVEQHKDKNSSLVKKRLNVPSDFDPDDYETVGINNKELKIIHVFDKEGNYCFSGNIHDLVKKGFKSRSIYMAVDKLHMKHKGMIFQYHQDEEGDSTS